MPTLDKERFDLVELLDVICSDARFEYPQHTLTLESPAQLATAHSSQRALNQALENIIRNALQHTPIKREVTVTVSAHSNNLSISIADKGPGVPEHLLEDIFLPFFQVVKSRAKKSALIPIAAGTRGGGFGLGLALAQRQIAAVGGTVTAQNLTHELEESVIGLKISILLPS